MNLQGLTVIFAIILLPIIIVVSVYLQGQIDTIALQTKYDNMLLDSTHDAVIALENNIANEDLSTVSDSLRSMIEASTNVFMNNIATNMGLSNAGESYIRPYIPALLYTLYDGFYIYSPTSVPEIYTNSDGVALRVGDKYIDKDGKSVTVTADGNNNYGQIVYEKSGGGYTTDLKDAEKHIKYVLKSYMYYNANYVGSDSGSNYNISVNYSLDNYISLSGTISDVYYSKSGYLINPDKVISLVLVNNITDEGKIDGIVFNPTGSSLNNKEEVFYKKYGSVIEKLSEEGSNKNLLSFNDEAIIEDFCKLDGIKLKVEVDGIEIKNYDLYSDELVSQATDAICYYGKAKIFSDWVNENLNMIKPSNDVNNIAFEYSTTFLKEEKGIEALKIDSNIFDLNSNDPEDITSDFWEHKREVIKSSIQYNLNLAISNYSSISSNQDYQMPILSETEWDKVLSNISMVSFMQDLPCKGKTYNNYAIVTSANSELIVIPNNLYYVPADKSNNEESEYHRIDCENLEKSEKDYYYLGYRSIEYLYDRKLENKQYEYDHKNFACYYCIVTGNYTKKELDNNKKRAYYTVLGKERNNLYKTTATVDNYGFEVTTFDSPKPKGTIDIDCSRKLNEVRSIEVVITKTEISDKRTQNLTNITLEIGGVSTTVTINANKNTTQTIVWNNIIVSENTNTSTNKTKPLQIEADELTTCNIASVKVIYK